MKSVYSENKDAKRYREIYKDENYVAKKTKRSKAYYKCHKDEMDEKQRDYYNLSRVTAVNNRALWAEDEDEYILEHFKKDMTLNEIGIAIAIGRSSQGVKNRIYKLQKVLNAEVQSMKYYVDFYKDGKLITHCFEEDDVQAKHFASLVDGEVRKDY